MEDVCQISNQLRRIVSINRFLEGVDVCSSGEEFAITGDDHGFDAVVFQAAIDRFGNDWQ